VVPKPIVRYKVSCTLVLVWWTGVWLPTRTKNGLENPSDGFALYLFSPSLNFGPRLRKVPGSAVDHGRTQTQSSTSSSYPVESEGAGSGDRYTRFLILGFLVQACNLACDSCYSLRFDLSLYPTELSYSGVRGQVAFIVNWH